MTRIRITYDAWGRESRFMSGHGWELLVTHTGPQVQVSGRNCRAFEYPVHTFTGDLSKHLAFIARTMPPCVYADYLQENGVSMHDRVYELLRSELDG